MGWQSRIDGLFGSLFARLLALQVLTVALLAGITLALTYTQRSATVARLYADQWAPHLASAAGLSTSAPGAPVLLQPLPPPDAKLAPLRGPRFAALREALAERGIVVDQVRLSPRAEPARLWLRVLRPGAEPAWLGVNGVLAPPTWPRRVVIGLGLTAVLLVLMSWLFTRRLTRPLEQLRTRLQAHRPGVPAPRVPPVAAAPEIMAIEAAWNDLAARLERHERERATLLAGVSHDLRGPLARIRMAAELLPAGEGVASRRDAIARNVAEADRLIESFLDHVRSAELPLEHTVDLAEAARSAVARFDPAPDPPGLSAPASLPWPRAHPLLVERLLHNLLDNAFKHGRPPVKLVLRHEAGAAVIEVIDAGAGMSPAQGQAMTEAFARGDASRGSPGSGLGLAIVRQGVQRLGGSLQFERRPSGFAVVVRLPPHVPEAGRAGPGVS